MDPLACNSCSRSFSTAPAFDRHRLRCRSRPRARKKACAECSRSKVRCDQGVPACSRLVFPSTLAGSAPLTPASNTPQSLWAPGDAQGPGLTDPLYPLSETGWVSDAVGDWEAFSFSDAVHGSAEGSLANIDALAAHSNSRSLIPENATPDSFQGLSAYLGEKWRTAESGVEFIERVLKGHIDGLACGLPPALFIHFRDWDETRRPLVLSEAKVLAQIYATRTPDVDSLLSRSIDTQLLLIQRNVTVLLYAMLRIYRSGPTASECIDRVSLRLMQHVLSKSLHCMTPHTDVTPSDWESWIQDESIRRFFFTLHALDYVTHARQALPTELCALFSDAPLPCPLHIWEASTAEEWAVRYRAWEEYCSPGGPLRARDVLFWVQGKRSGREEQLRVWFQGVGDALGGGVFECARAQTRVAGVEGLF
ncbi:hypothetical protein C8A01DRAFT_15677 [Parachaetomium inaequale]|uniref:Zn(2)-C6 fungal-type domain-containing protein n=1 Tax=Parachaetomium inaequale TaxID=2588326 RepID=A0AAN6SSI6_9PEZI|nr:hypothetical protein C8A01DRAFT_15677 [Parachaetomium inaequale]